MKSTINNNRIKETAVSGGKTTGIARKLSLFFVGAAMLSSTSLLAQQQKTSSDSTLSPKFGIKGALNLTYLYDNDASNTKHLKAGWNAGVFAKLPITKGFSIQPEVLYSVKGAKESYDFGSLGSGDVRFNLGYVEVPVLAVVNLTPWFNIQAGGYAAYLTNANVKNVDNNGNVQGSSDLKTSDFNRWDFGLAGGVGFDVENFTIGARYNYGLSHIGKTDNATGDLLQNSKNAGLSVYVGFGF